MKDIINQLSSREKRLLYFLICFLVVVGAWYFLITPQLDKRTDLNAQYEMALNENASKQMELVKVQAAPEQLKQKKESLNEIIEKYNPIMSDEKIDKMVTTLLLSNRLNPRSLTIGEISNVNLSKDENKQDNTNQETTTENSYVKQVSVIITTSGTLTNILKAVDDFNNMDGIQIASFTYSEPTPGSLVTDTTSTMTIIIYMAQQQ